MALLPRYSVIDPSRLGKMKVIDSLDSEAIITNRMQRFIALWKLRDPPAAALYDVENLEFDPIKILTETSSLVQLQLEDRVNQAARAVTLANAISTDLDAIASRYPGGIPRFDGEADEAYRRRIWASVNPLSPHGPTGSYEFWGLTALGPIIRDVTATKVRPSLKVDPIIIITLMKEGADPKPTKSELIEARRYIIDERRAAITDVLSIRAPHVIQTKYVVGVWLYPGPDNSLVLSEVKASLQALVEKQRWLGQDHMLDAIKGAVMLQDVHSCEVREPATDIRVDPTAVVQVTAVEVLYLGRKE